MACSSSFVMSRPCMSAHYDRIRLTSPVRQLELDTAIAAEGFFGPFRIDRLELAKAGRHQPLRRNPATDEILHDRNGARRRQIPIAAEGSTRRSANIGVAVDTQRPG